MSFWWRRWIEHSRSPHVRTVPWLSHEHLDLDVARRRDDLLDVHRPVAERRQRLGGGTLVELLHVGRLLDAPHPAPAAARRRLEQHRVAELVGSGARLVRPRDALHPRHERHTGGAHLGLRACLVAHPLHHLGRRPDEDEVVLLARTHEVGVLGEEAVAGMHRLAAGRLRGGDDRGDAEVALPDRRRADSHGAVRELYVERVGIGRRIDRDGFDPELVEGTDDADGDLAAIRNEDALEHRARV